MTDDAVQENSAPSKLSDEASSPDGAHRNPGFTERCKERTSHFPMVKNESKRMIMQKYMMAALIAVVGMLLTACAHAEKPEQNTRPKQQGVLGESIPYMTSMINLIAHPEKYDAKLVQVVGYLHLEFEEDRICLHKEDSDRGIPHNCLSIGVFDKSLQNSKDELRTLTDNYVMMEGTFEQDEDEIYQFDAGELTNIRRADLWSQDKH